MESENNQYDGDNFTLKTSKGITIITMSALPNIFVVTLPYGEIIELKYPMPEEKNWSQISGEIIDSTFLTELSMCIEDHYL